MYAVILAVLIAAALVLIGRQLAGRRPTSGDEVERFHRARQMTTDWSRQGPVQPIFADDAAIDLTEHERAEQDSQAHVGA